MKTAACYIRVSTDDQTEYSPDSQLKLIREYAEKHNIVLLEDYIFMEDGGKSGKNMSKRTEFMKLISLTKQKTKPFDAILVWKFSRFARNQEESIVLKSMLRKKEIDVVSISESLPEGPFGSLVERIIEWSDEYYLINLSQEVKRGMLEKASRGEPVCPPPVGYDMIDGKYIPNNDAQFVKNIFSDYLNGLGIRTIANKYAKLGLRTKRGNVPDNRFVEYMLRNPVYKGKIRWSSDGRGASRRNYENENTIIYDGIHEPLVPEDVFDKVQEKIKEIKIIYGKHQRSEQPAQFMLKGLVRCSNCGATLVHNQRNAAVQCHNYSRGTCNVSHHLSLNKANKAILDYLKSMDISNIIVSRRNLTSEPSQTVDYERLLLNAKKRLERIKQAYQDGIDTLDEYKKNKQQVQEHIERLIKEQKAQAPKTKVNDRLTLRQRIKDVVAILEDVKASEESKNIALRSIIERIVYVRSENRFEITFYI